MRRTIYSEEEIETIIILYKSGLGTTRIARAIKKGNRHKVEYVLRLANVQMRPPFKGRPQNTFPETYEITSFIDGLLLGDGGMFPVCGKHKNSGITVTQSTKNIDFLYWIRENFAIADVPVKIYQQKPRPPSRSAHVLYTPRSIEFTVFYKRWYLTGKKQPPNDIRLTPLALICWYLGDGTKHNNGAIILYTNSFSFSNAQMLIKLLYDDLGIVANVQKHIPGKNSWSKNPSKATPIIYIPVRQSNIAFEIMGPCPVSSLAYKWPDRFPLASRL